MLLVLVTRECASLSAGGSGHLAPTLERIHERDDVVFVESFVLS
jgi:hypothetical protein